MGERGENLLLQKIFHSLPCGLRFDSSISLPEQEKLLTYTEM